MKDLHDEAWLAENTVGWPQLEAKVADYPPSRVARITGLSAGDIVKLARLYAGVRPGLIKIADGLTAAHATAAKRPAPS